MTYAKGLTKKFNDNVARSTFGRFFRLGGSGHEKEIKGTRFTTEIRAGLTTFVTLAYIISVNAAIIKDTGGTCVCNNETDPICLTDPEYNACVTDIQRDLITATSAISGFGSFLFGVLTNMPIALTPGMGLNDYFAYQVVGFHGSGNISYELALAAVFAEGWIFMLMSFLGMRQWLVKALPGSIKIACACGIGLFLALIGLSYTAGIGAVTGGYPAPLDLGGCPPQYLDEFGKCTSHRMQNPALWIAIFCGGFLTVLLMAYRFRSAMIVGIFFVSVISWPRTTSFTYFPYTGEGNNRFDFFKTVVGVNPIKRTLNVIDWNAGANPGQFVLALVTFLYVDIFDATATLYSMAKYAGVVDAEDGSFPRSTIAYTIDAFSISIGSLVGTSPVTAFIESGAGIAEGGRTGLTAITTGICFVISIFFAPLFASIPPWATGCTLIIIGCMMMRQIIWINWNYVGDAIPAFVTLVSMPFTYSIAYGLIAGLMVHISINGFIWLVRVASGGRIVPDDDEKREHWNFHARSDLSWKPRIEKIRKAFKIEDEVATDRSVMELNDTPSRKSETAVTVSSPRSDLSRYV